MKRVYSLLSFILLGISGWLIWGKCTYSIYSQLNCAEVREVLATIPPEEKKYLAEFFRYSVTWCNFAYTLTDEKPLSEVCICDRPNVGWHVNYA